MQSTGKCVKSNIKGIYNTMFSIKDSLRSRRYLGGGMRRREKESEEKWEGRERNSACRKAICFLIFRVRERTRNSDWLISHQGFPNYIPCGFR